MQLVWAKWLARLPGRRRSVFSIRHNQTAPGPFTIPPLCLLLLLTVLRSHSLCQDFAAVRGVVTDSLLNTPIAGVIITALPDGQSALTSADGRFQIRRLFPGSVTFQIESAFHVPRTIGPFLLRDGEERTFDILLSPLRQQGERVDVTAARESGIGIKSLEISKSSRAGAADVGELLNQNGVYLESDGRTKYASLRGFSPQCILILIDGVPINPNGAPADLSTIPTESIERVDIYTTGAASRFGANALGGAVNIISRSTASPDHTAGLAATSGSFGLQRGAANLSLSSLGNVTTTAGYDYQQQRNDFSFEHPYDGEQKRANNSSRVYSGYLSLRPEQIRGLILQARLSNSHIEIPGAIFQETSGGAMAKRENRNYSLGYSLSKFRITAAFRELRQKFADRGGFIAYDKDYLQTIRLVHGEFASPLLRHFIVTAGSEFSSENFYNDDRIATQRSLPAVARKTAAVYGGLTGVRAVGNFELSSEARYRIDHIAGKSHGSPFAGIGVKWLLPVVLGAQASYSESFRLPPIDALFWRGDVFSEANPDLHPEQAISREVELTLKYERSFVIVASHSWFNSDVTDLIIWRRQFDGKYKPVNINRSQYVGSESSITVAPKNRRLGFSYHRTSLDATNLSGSSGYYGMTVPFKPDLVERFSLDIDLTLCRARYSYSYTGERQIREANTKQLPGYALHDLSVEVPFSLWARNHALQAAVFNLTDEHYELLERMPMPPRCVSLTLNIQI